MKSNDSTAGYSGTPLYKKLGIKEGQKVFIKNMPESYFDLLYPIPYDVTFVLRLSSELDIIHFFTKSRLELEKHLKKYKTRIKQNGVIWVSWPKKSSKILTDITEDTIREIALPLDLVDVKVCAVNDVWSGLKLVIRKEKRI